MKKKGNIVTQILPAIVVPLVLIIGVIVFAEFNASITPTDYSNSAQLSINKTQSNTYTGFNLGSIMPLVIFASVILAVILGAFVFTRQ